MTTETTPSATWDAMTDGQKREFLASHHVNQVDLTKDVSGKVGVLRSNKPKNENPICYTVRAFFHSIAVRGFLSATPLYHAPQLPVHGLLHCRDESNRHCSIQLHRPCKRIFRLSLEQGKELLLRCLCQRRQKTNSSISFITGTNRNRRQERTSTTSCTKRQRTNQETWPWFSSSLRTHSLRTAYLALQ